MRIYLNDDTIWWVREWSFFEAFDSVFKCVTKKCNIRFFLNFILTKFTKLQLIELNKTKI